MYIIYFYSGVNLLSSLDISKNYFINEFESVGNSRGTIFYVGQFRALDWRIRTSIRNRKSFRTILKWKFSKKRISGSIFSTLRKNRIIRIKKRCWKSLQRTNCGNCTWNNHQRKLTNIQVIHYWASWNYQWRPFGNKKTYSRSIVVRLKF